MLFLVKILEIKASCFLERASVIGYRMGVPGGPRPPPPLFKPFFVTLAKT